ncbi:MAG TPA: helix-turn-helix domain-containing protein [Actinophytocola sp.]|jgi:sugar-specific transcriptional regulator TrmB/DNA-binding CsgD family transcriptional regulator|uniref:helix-turn-helix domain-containing protein n=1 Tax=Actinophytocola sp. TaxID=1872138 RepID=UPI002E062360|nr:helix-turn-helix domain-containing protein [Actinophytocola sp.]
MELDSLGVTPAEQQLYELLLANPDPTLAELAGLTGLGASRLRVLLRSLADKGLVARNGGRPARFAPSPPDIAVEVLALRRQQEIEHARLLGVVFCQRVQPRSWSTVESPVAVVHGRAAVGHRFRQLQELARRELLILDKPPYVVEPDGDQHELQQELLARGVRYRTIYDRDALGPAERVEKLRQLAARGEEARVLAGVPMKLVIADGRVGLAPHDLPGTDPVTGTAVLIRASALLDGLVTLFETLWEQATPMWPQHRFAAGHDPAEPLSSRDQQLLALLAAGLTDQAIARKLGVALRTVERRVRRMMDGLGARTRFQAGLQAAARGLYGSEGEPDDRDGSRLSPGTP